MKHAIIARASLGRRHGVRYEATRDDQGIVRTGPVGAWWANLRPRAANGIGISYEAPRWRMCAWNVMFVTGEAVGAAWLHRSGFSWTEVGAVYASAFTAGIGYIFGALPVLAYRLEQVHAADLAQWQADAALVEAEVQRRHLARYGVDISRAAMRARLEEFAPEAEKVAA